MQGKRKTPASNAVVGGLHLSRSSTTASPQRPHRRPHATDEHLLLALVGGDLVESFLCRRSSSSTRSSEVLAERSLRWREAPPPHARRRRACGAVPALVGGVLAEPSSRSSEAFLWSRPRARRRRTCRVLPPKLVRAEPCSGHRWGPSHVELGGGGHLLSNITGAVLLSLRRDAVSCDLFVWERERDCAARKACEVRG
jgi:hypothetical protein